MALPSLAMKCKLHHKLIVIMKKAGSKSLFSHMYCTVQTHLFKLLVRMEFLRILRTNLGTTWQNQSYMHVAVITFNPSHAWPFQKLSLMEEIMTIIFVYMCILVGGQPELVHVSLVSQQCRQTGNFANSVTYKLQ